MRHVASFLFVALTALACSEAGDDQELGGETHWLRTCEVPADCNGKYSCVCGFCTETCDANSECKSLDDDAVCVDSLETLYADQCTGKHVSFCAEKSFVEEAPSCSANEVSYDGECVTCNAANRETQARLETLAESYAECSQHSDCILTEPTLDCGGACTAVNFSEQEDYLAETEQLELALCADPLWQGECKLSSVGCEAFAACVDGQCQVTDEAPLCESVGRRFDPQQLCYGDLEVAEEYECVPGEEGGPAAFFYLADDDGICWQFTGTRLPESFERDPNCPMGPWCEGTCAVAGRLLDEERGCFGEPEVLSRFEADNCGSATIVLWTTARDPEGRCWWFPGGGFPDGFTEVTGTDETCDAQIQAPCPD